MAICLQCNAEGRVGNSGDADNFKTLEHLGAENTQSCNRKGKYTCFLEWVLPVVGKWFQRFEKEL